jgi:2-polyprenyl-3-methyl-5-hydroxy-6-metoxy-1,4-benzoquinol methylase
MTDRNVSANPGIYDLPVRRLDPASHPDERIAPCPVCAEVRAAPQFEITGYDSRVLVCRRCGLGRLHPIPSAEELRALYPDEYYGEPGTKFQPIIERLVRIVGERHVGFLCGAVPPGGRVLDVGCGRGVLLGALADRGFEVHGVEVSAAAASGADPRAQIRVAATLGDAGYPESSFDLIIVWHVFEHIADPRGTVEEMRRILKPGGRVVIAVPNFASPQARWTGPAWFHLDLPRHIHQFPLAALRDLLAEVGLEVVSEHHFSLRQNPFGWIQSILNRWPGLPRNGLYSLLHRRGRGEAPPFDAWTRARLWFWLVALTPLGLVATLLETLLRCGATVHVVARRPDAPGHA